MKNYKNIFLEFLNECDSKDNKENLSPNMEIALDIIKRIVTLRFENELKQYNGNEEKAYDEFIAERILTILNYYVEELYLIDKYEDEYKYKGIRKEMRYIVNDLRYIYNDNK